jgi:hypothetical protein
VDPSGIVGAQVSVFPPDPLTAWMKMNLPLPGTPGAPFFQGPEVSRFLKVVEGLFARHCVAAARDKLVYLADCCSESVYIWLTCLPEFEAENYDKVVECLKDEYADQDRILRRLNI